MEIHAGNLFDVLGGLMTEEPSTDGNPGCAQLPILIQVGKGCLMAEIQGIFLSAQGRSLIIKAGEPFVQFSSTGRRLL